MPPPSQNKSKCLHSYCQAVCKALRNQKGGRAAQYSDLLSEFVWQQHEEDVTPPPSEPFLRFVAEIQQGLEIENEDTSSKLLLSSSVSNTNNLLAAFIGAITEWIATDGPYICCDPLALAVGIASEIAELNSQATQRAGGDILLPLLVIGGDVGAGADGIRASLNFLSLGVPGLIKAQAALASMLRTHLQKCPVDLSFLFAATVVEPPSQNQCDHEKKYPDGNSNSTKLKPRQQQQLKSAGTTTSVSKPKAATEISPTGLELPRHFNWEGYRGYTVLLYVELSLECLSREVSIFKLRIAGGEGIEVNLVRGVEVNVTSYPRGGSTHTVSASFPRIQMGNGSWQLLSISHSLPYLKRPQIRIAVDDVVILEEDLSYPTCVGASGSVLGDVGKKGGGGVGVGFPFIGSGQWIQKRMNNWDGTRGGVPRGVLCEGMVGKLSYAAMFEGELSLSALRYIVSVGPGHLAGMPAPSPHPPHELDKEILRGSAYNECMEARMLWAYIPFMSPQSGDFVPDVVQMGKPNQRWTEVCSPPPLTQRGGGMRSMARLTGGVRVNSAYAPTSTCTSSRAGGIYDAWFRAGGIKAVLFLMGSIVDTSQNMACEWDLDVSSCLASLLGILTALMKGSPAHREEALQHHAFHMICVILHRLPRPASQLNVAVISACLEFLELDIDSTRNYYCGSSTTTTVSRSSQQSSSGLSSMQTTNQAAVLTLDFILIGAALQGLLLDHSLWLMAPPLLHTSLLKRIADRVDCSPPFVRALSRYVGVHHLLDMMRFIASHYDEPPPPPPKPELKGVTGRRHGPGAEVQKSLNQDDNDETLLDLCHHIVLEVISWDLSGTRLPSAGGATATRKRSASEGFMTSTSSSLDSTSSSSSSIRAVLAVLHEAQNESLLLTLLQLLLQLRQTHHDELRWTLLAGGFLHVTAPVLLGSGGHSRDVRVECLTLTVWLLTNVHKGEEELWSFPFDPLVNINNAPGPPSSINASGGTVSSPTATQSNINRVYNSYFLEEDEREPLHIALARCIVSAVSKGLWEVGKSCDADPSVYASTVMEAILPGGGRGGRRSSIVSETATAPAHHQSFTNEPYSDHSRMYPWLVLPFAASVMSICSPNEKEQAALYVNTAIKSDSAVRKVVQSRSGSVWIECLVEIAISDKLSSLSNNNNNTVRVNRSTTDSSIAAPENENEIQALQAERSQWKSINFSPDSTVCEELALDAIGCMLSDVVLAKHHRGGSDWKLWHRLLSSLDYAATQQLGGGETGKHWLESTLSCIIVLILHSMKRGGRWSSASLDGVSHMVALADEKLVSVQTQPYLINCLIETSRGLRGVLSESSLSPSFGQGGSSGDHDLVKVEEREKEDDQANRRLRAQAVLRVLLRAIVRSLRMSTSVTHMNLVKSEHIKVSISSANESMEALDSLLVCPELPAPAAVQTVLQVFSGFHQAILETEPSFPEVRSHLSACIMDTVHRHCHVSPVNRHGRKRRDSPNATAVRYFLLPAANCDSIEGIFYALGPDIDAFAEEASQDLNDFVPRFSKDCAAATTTTTTPIPSPSCGEPEPSSSVDSKGNDAIIEDGSLSCTAAASHVTQSVVLSNSLNVGQKGGVYQLSQAHIGSNNKSWLDGHLVLHSQRVEDEKLRIMRCSAAIIKEMKHCQKAWVRMSRSAEAELQLGHHSSISFSESDCDHDECNAAAHQRHLTGLYRHCQWKLPSGVHEGKPPGRIRIALKPVVDGKKRVITSQTNVPSASNNNSLGVPVAEASSHSLSKGGSMSTETEKLGKQLALQSEFIVDITKRVPEDEKMTDIGGSAAAGEVRGGGGTPDMKNIEIQQVVPTMLPLVDGESGGGGDGHIRSLSPHEPTPLDGTMNNDNGSKDDDDDEDEKRKEEDIYEVELDSTEDVTTVLLGRVPLGPSASLPQLPNLTSIDGGGSLKQKGGEPVTVITPKGNALGRLLIVKKQLYFVPNILLSGGGGGGGVYGQQEGAQNHHCDQAASSVTGDVAGSATILLWPLHDVKAIYTRRYRLVDSALELFIMTGGVNQSVFVDFGVTNHDVKRRDEFLRMLGRMCGKDTVKYWPREVQNLMQAWQERQISNLEYLLGLNTLAGRSFNDLCQYPVLPWVLSCYCDDKEAYDLQNPNCFRDLSKPMGAINDERLKEYLSRYESFHDPHIPPFMYGSHYSTAVGVILHYFVRLEPFSSLHQRLHDGSFDVPDRLFSSIPHAWKICISALSDVKELTPEWYTLPDFLRNVNQYDFGETHDGVPIEDVELPKWANDPEDFVHKHRAALESDYVTHNLHKWIDLVFGYKQQGPEAVTAHNVFYYLTYYGAIDLTQIEDEGLRHATELQIAHFGQCPMQLFERPHPRFHQRSCIPRPLSLSLKAIDTWMEEEYRALRKTKQIVPPLSRAEVGVRCMKILRDGHILTVNGLGVVELFAYRWRTPDSSYNEGGGGGDNIGTANLSGDRNAPSPVHTKRAFSNPEQHRPNSQQATRVTDYNNESATSAGQLNMISFLEVQRILPGFDVLPRIPLPTGCDYHSKHSSCASALPHPAPAVLSSLGKLLFSGGHPSGAVLVWELDTATGAIVAEGSLTGHSAPVTCLSLGGMEPSGQDLLLSGSCDCTALVWELRKLTSRFNRPQLSRTPYRVIRGHSHPITACSINVYAGLCLTVSHNTALIHCIASDQLLRVLQPTPSSQITPTPLREEKNKGDFGVVKSRSDYHPPSCNSADDIQPVFNYFAAVLSPDGYAVLAFQEDLPYMTGSEYHHPDGANSCCIAVSAISSLESFTVSGQSVGKVTVDKGCYHHLRTVRTLSVVRNLLVAGGDKLLLQVRSVRDLSLVWEMNSSMVAVGRDELPLITTTATAGAKTKTQWSGGTKGVGDGGRGATAVSPSVACVEFGPSPETPILLCVGLTDGSMVVQALPGAEEWLSTSMLSTVGNIINLPVRVVKGGVQQAQSLAVSGWRRMSKAYRTGEKIVKQEMAEEAQSIVQEVQSKGLVKGIVGYLRPETSQEGEFCVDSE